MNRRQILEKLRKAGVKSLSGRELISLITDCKNPEKNIMRFFHDRCSGEEIAARRYLTVICAAMELSRRNAVPEKFKILRSSDVLPLLESYSHFKQECFLSVNLNGAHEVISVNLITMGLVNRTQIHAREFFVRAIEDRATSVIAAHNHPSGDPEPSPEDILATKRLHAAGKLLGIELLDHIIFSAAGHYSFAREQKLQREDRP